MQRVVDGIFKGLTGTVCFVYLDDVGIPDDDFETHVDNVCEILRRLKLAKMAV